MDDFERSWETVNGVSLNSIWYDWNPPSSFWRLRLGSAEQREEHPGGLEKRDGALWLCGVGASTGVFLIT